MKNRLPSDLPRHRGVAEFSLLTGTWLSEEASTSHGRSKRPVLPPQIFIWKYAQLSRTEEAHLSQAASKLIVET